MRFCSALVPGVGLWRLHVVPLTSPVLVPSCSVCVRLDALVSEGKLLCESSGDGDSHYYTPAAHRTEGDICGLVTRLLRRPELATQSDWRIHLPAVLADVLEARSSMFNKEDVLDSEGNIVPERMLSEEQVRMDCLILVPFEGPGVAPFTMSLFWTCYRLR